MQALVSSLVASLHHVATAATASFQSCSQNDSVSLSRLAVVEAFLNIAFARDGPLLMPQAHQDPTLRLSLVPPNRFQGEQGAARQTVFAYCTLAQDLLTFKTK